jgi:hypothetical protein
MPFCRRFPCGQTLLGILKQVTTRGGDTHGSYAPMRRAEHFGNGTLYLQTTTNIRDLRSTDLGPLAVS